MFRNYFTIGWRNLLRTKVYAIINITGLAVGMAVAILIGLWVYDEISYDSVFPNYERIAQIQHHLTFGDEIFTLADLPAPLGETLRETVPEFEEVAITTGTSHHYVTNSENTKLQGAGRFVEPSFLSIFSIHETEGAKDPLKDINSILLSKSFAREILGDDPIGKTLKFDNHALMTVTGVFDDFPKNSTFADLKMLMPIAYHFNFDEIHRKQQSNWEDYSFECFALLKDQVQLQHAESKIQILKDKGSNDAKALKPEGIIFPMSKWHLYAEFKDGKNLGGQIKFVLMFTVIGVIVLLLACINFMNLSTARSEKRSKEVGVRKVMGSRRSQLMLQFLSESLLMVSLGYAAGFLIAILCLPMFNEIAGKVMVIPWREPLFYTVSVIFILVTSFLAGSYPALFLSAFNPVKVLKGTFKTGRGASIPRKTMVIVQFSTSIVLIVCTVIVFQQVQHAKNRPVGFDLNGIFHFDLVTEGLKNADYNSLRHELLATGVVENMAMSDRPVTGGMSADASLTWEGKDPSSKPLIAINACTHDFPKTNGFQFIVGRDFSRELASDSSAVVINELAAKMFRDGNPIGKKFTNGNGRQSVVVGVIKDQIRWTPFMKQSPHIYYISYKATGSITIRLNPTVGPHDALAKIEAVIKKFDEHAPFDYKFLDEDYARQFHDQERIGKLASILSVLAIFISCVGIFGLATFTASQRTKEIGIRKVLGASVYNVWRLISNEFMLLVLISILLGTPLAYYFAVEWLSQYEYRVAISWTVFAMTGLLALVITILTVSYQAIKTAMLNPVNSLKAE